MLIQVKSPPSQKNKKTKTALEPECHLEQLGTKRTGKIALGLGFRVRKAAQISRQGHAVGIDIKQLMGDATTFFIFYKEKDTIARRIKWAVDRQARRGTAWHTPMFDQVGCKHTGLPSCLRAGLPFSCPSLRCWYVGRGWTMGGGEGGGTCP